MLVIRLRRVGRRHDPHYRIVVAEHTSPVQGSFVAEIGHYHPKSKQTVIDKEAMIDWMNKGAKPSNTVAKLAEKSKIEHKHVVVKQYMKKSKQEQPVEEAKSDAQRHPELVSGPVEETAETPVEETTESIESDETPDGEVTETPEETVETAVPAEETPTESTDEATE